MSEIKKRTTTTSKCYDEEGRLISEDVIEEIEYEPSSVTNPRGGVLQPPIYGDGIMINAQV